MKYSALGISLGILAAVVFVLGSFLIGFVPNAVAVNKTDTATIDITVGTLTMVDMNPAEFIWSGINPGTAGVRKQAQIENIGSTNFTYIWFNVTQPSNRPFGTGFNSSYNAANFVWIARENSTDSPDSEYFAVDRLEFNETRSLVYLTDPEGNTPPDHSKFTYGRFRNTSFEYFWFINKTDDCDGATFWVGDVAHRQGVTGTIDFSSCVSGLNNAPGTTCRYGALTDAGNGWCYADVNIGGRNYTVAVDNTTVGYKVRWFHWNADAPGGRNFRVTNNNQWFSTITIYPGNSTVADLKVYVPYGVAKGLLTQGTLTVIVSSDPESS